MKQRLLIFVAALAVLGGGLAAVPSVNAESSFVSNDDNVTLAKDDVHNGAYFATSKDIVINGTVNGDVYCAGQSVEVNGTVNGDVICVAQTVKINGTVTQDVRTAAQFVTIAGNVAGTVTSFGQEVEIAKASVIGGDLNGAAQNVTVDGTVKRDLAIGSDSLTISGVVLGSARVNTASMTLKSEPAIKGNLEYNALSEQAITDGAVSGTVKFNQDGASSSDGEAMSTIINLFLFIAGAVMVTAIVIALVAPRFLERSQGLVHKKIGQTILVGVAVNFGLPVFALALALTGVGLPLAFVLFAALLIVNVLAFPFAAYYLSRALFGQVIHNIVLLMIAGIAMVIIAMMIPLVNVLVYFAVLTIGVGGVVLTLTNGYRKPHYSLEQFETKSNKKK